MPIHPRTPKDLMLAPVAAEVDLNLQHLRDKSPGEIDDAIALSLNLDDDELRPRATESLGTRRGDSHG